MLALKHGSLNGGLQSRTGPCDSPALTTAMPLSQLGVLSQISSAATNVILTVGGDGGRGVGGRCCRSGNRVWESLNINKPGNHQLVNIITWAAHALCPLLQLLHAVRMTLVSGREIQERTPG